MKTVMKDTIFTNVALHAGRRRVVGGQGRPGRPPSSSTGRATPGRRARRRRPRTRTRASPRPRRTTRGSRSSPTIRTACRSARSSSAAAARRPCRSCMQAFNWLNGVFFGATLGSRDDRGRDRQGRRRAPRPDGDAALLRLQHGRLLPALAARCSRSITHPPKIFLVNWFRKDKDGKFLWPGLRREHARAQVDRRSRAPARRRSGDVVRLGAARRATSISRASTSRTSRSTRRRTSISTSGRRSSSRYGEFFDTLGPSMPRALKLHRELLVARIEAVKGGHG